MSGEECTPTPVQTRTRRAQQNRNKTKKSKSISASKPSRVREEKAKGGDAKDEGDGMSAAVMTPPSSALASTADTVPVSSRRARGKVAMPNIIEDDDDDEDYDDKDATAAAAAESDSDASPQGSDNENDEDDEDDIKSGTSSHVVRRRQPAMGKAAVMAAKAKAAAENSRKQPSRGKGSSALTTRGKGYKGKGAFHLTFDQYAKRMNAVFGKVPILSKHFTMEMLYDLEVCRESDPSRPSMRQLAHAVYEKYFDGSDDWFEHVGAKSNTSRSIRVFEMIACCGKFAKITANSANMLYFEFIFEKLMQPSATIYQYFTPSKFRGIIDGAKAVKRNKRKRGRPERKIAEKDEEEEDEEEDEEEEVQAAAEEEAEEDEEDEAPRSRKKRMVKRQSKQALPYDKASEECMSRIEEGVENIQENVVSLFDKYAALEQMINGLVKENLRASAYARSFDTTMRTLVSKVDAISTAPAYGSSSSGSTAGDVVGTADDAHASEDDGQVDVKSDDNVIDQDEAKGLLQELSEQQSEESGQQPEQKPEESEQQPEESGQQPESQPEEDKQE